MKQTVAIVVALLFAVGLYAQPAEEGAGAPEAPTPFEPTPGELISEEFDETQMTDEQRAIRARNLRAEELWKNADYRDYDRSFAELHELSRAFANNRYRLSLSNYQAGVNSIMKMRDEVILYQRESRLSRQMHEKWYWQVVDRQNQEQRRAAQLRRQAKMDAVTYFTRSINHLDSILNPELREKPAFKRLASAVYRNWAMYQYDLGNIPQIIPILELYLEIDDNEQHYPAHKYLSQAYAFQETMVRRHGAGTEDQMMRFRFKKNAHLLRATELRYGQESAEYRHVINLVNRDEIISVQP